MKRSIFVFLALSVLLFGGDFREGMIAYKKGDFKKAKILFEIALKEGAILPYFMLGKMYLYGEGIPQDINKSIEYLEKSSQEGNIRAKCYLAEAYLKKDKENKKAAELIKFGLKRNINECKKVSQTYGITLN